METAHQEITDLIGGYCLGGLEADDKQRLEAHLWRGCPDCESVFREMRQVMVFLPYAAEPVAPPLHLKQKILSAIQADDARVVRTRRQLNARSKWVAVRWGLAFAAIIIIAGLGWYVGMLQNEISRLQSQIAFSERLVLELRAELAKQERVIRVMRSPAFRIVTLSGLDAAPSASGRIFWDPEENEAVFYAFDLPHPPPDKDYQLWVIRGNQPRDAGVFTTDAQGAGVLTVDRMPDSGEVSAFAVTLEPKGGVPQPTGQMMLLGTAKEG